MAVRNNFRSNGLHKHGEERQSIIAAYSPKELTMFKKKMFWSLGLSEIVRYALWFLCCNAETLKRTSIFPLNEQGGGSRHQNREQTPSPHHLTLPGTVISITQTLPGLGVPIFLPSRQRAILAILFFYSFE